MGVYCTVDQNKYYNLSFINQQESTMGNCCAHADSQKPSKTLASYNLSGDKPCQEDSMDQSQFLGDKMLRVQLHDMQNLLHRNIGPLISEYQDQNKHYIISGTAFLISPNLALTCAHNIYNRDIGIKCQTVLFYPGQCGELKNGIQIQKFYYPPQYEKKYEKQEVKYEKQEVKYDKQEVKYEKQEVKYEKQNEKQKELDHRYYDWAILKLKQPVSQTQFIKMCGDEDHLKKNDVLAIYGYPATYDHVENDGKIVTKISQHGLKKSDRILDIVRSQDRQMIEHIVSTRSGQSGSPVVRIDQNGSMTIVGIHLGNQNMGQKYKGQEYKKKYKTPLTVVNVGRLITNRFLGILKVKAEEWQAQMFEQYPKQSKLSRIFIDLGNDQREEEKLLKSGLSVIEQESNVSTILIGALLMLGIVVIVYLKTK